MALQAAQPSLDPATLGSGQFFVQLRVVGVEVAYGDDGGRGDSAYASYRRLGIEIGVARGVYTWEPSEPRAIYNLPPAAILVGNVLGTPQLDAEKEWAPVENVLVQVVEQIENENVTVGEATTRADGEFRVLIPATPR